MLHQNKWNVAEVLFKYCEYANDLFVTSRMKTLQPVLTKVKKDKFVCPICVTPIAEELEIKNLACGHCYCNNCWRLYFEIKIIQGVSVELSCKSLICELLVPGDMVLSTVDKPILLEQYQHFAFIEYIKMHPLLRFCPGANCNAVFKSKKCFANKAICTQCNISFCFKCGNDNHAPMDCTTFRKWITTLPETANLLYIKANTKNCPKCNIGIEKYGGFNRMQCSSFNFKFCWMCL